MNQNNSISTEAPSPTKTPAAAMRATPETQMLRMVDPAHLNDPAALPKNLPLYAAFLESAVMSGILEMDIARLKLDAMKVLQDHMKTCRSCLLKALADLDGKADPQTPPHLEVVKN